MFLACLAVFELINLLQLGEEYKLWIPRYSVNLVPLLLPAPRIFSSSANVNSTALGVSETPGNIPTGAAAFTRCSHGARGRKMTASWLYSAKELY
jgi:hypothetical protein